MLKKKVIFWGATGQAIVLEEIIRNDNVELLAIFDNNDEASSPISGVPVYHKIQGFEDWQKNNQLQKTFFCVAIAGNKGHQRVEMHNFLIKKGLIPYSCKHKTAYISDSSVIGEGVQILANSSVCARVKLGNQVIINTSSSVDHECQIADGVHIGPGAKLAGCIIVNRAAFIGTGAVVLPHLSIGEGAIIGAGAVVTRSVEPFSVVVGNPAKLLMYVNQ